MTTTEALKILGRLIVDAPDSDTAEALNRAAAALDRLEPMPVTEYDDGATCPRCKMVRVYPGHPGSRFCRSCGQRIGWSEVDA